jgi:hypothetical protein
MSKRYLERDITLIEYFIFVFEAGTKIEHKLHKSPMLKLIFCVKILQKLQLDNVFFKAIGENMLKSKKS